MSLVGERGSLEGLAWGLPLVTASALSRAADSGEVLVAEDLFIHRAAEIEALGFRGEGDHIRRLVRAAERPYDGRREPPAGRSPSRSPPLPRSRGPTRSRSWRSARCSRATWRRSSGSSPT